ncbi:hypothetical protein LCGC14_1400860 [marine sediment metagenome]|uniref:Uncharacterized protein n=1 Tax=marine sediment metagenome TaxID=412755 RepID=A0A0F9JX61_9ZZZZ
MIDKKEIIRRRSDDKLFYASVPPGYSEYDAFAALISGVPGWYFVGIEKIPPRWYWPFTTYRKTGETWDTKDHRAFDMASR